MANNEVFWFAGRISLLVDKTTGTPVVKSGDPVRVGAMNAVAVTDAGRTVDTGSNVGFVPALSANANRIPSGNKPGYASCKTFGSWKVTVAAVAAISAGTPIYAIADADTAVKKVSLTTTATGNKLWGVALEAVPSGGTPLVHVKLVETAV
jgi:predicted RecA/RadA family phage recombinase